MKQINYKVIAGDGKPPKQSTEYAFGYDVTAVSCTDVTRETFEKSMIGLHPIEKFFKRLKWRLTRHSKLLKYGIGLVLQPEDKPTNLNRAIIIVPRSSVYKTGMQLTNDVGIVDCDEYTGEISMVFRVLDGNLPHYQIGDRIGQLFFVYSEKLNFQPGIIRETKRGAGGYGSTGR